MANPKDTISTIVGYVSAGIAVLQAAIMAYNTWLATATAAPTVMEYVQLAILIGIAVIGVLTGKNANLSAKTDSQLVAQEKASEK